MSKITAKELTNIARLSGTSVPTGATKRVLAQSIAHRMSSIASSAPASKSVAAGRGERTGGGNDEQRFDGINGEFTITTPTPRGRIPTPAESDDDD
jgi:hypothetical protein